MEGNQCIKQSLMLLAGVTLPEQVFLVSLYEDMVPFQDLQHPGGKIFDFTEGRINMVSWPKDEFNDSLTEFRTTRLSTTELLTTRLRTTQLRKTLLRSTQLRL